MTIDLKEHEWRKWSQHGEDGVLVKIFEEIGVTNETFFEIGAHFHEANALYLQQTMHWKGAYMDDFHEFRPLGFFKVWINRDNVVPILQQFRYPTIFDLFSIDIDGYDVHVLNAVLHNGYYPRIIVCEGILEMGNENLTIPYDGTYKWNGEGVSGSSFSCMHELLTHYGYRLVYIESTGVNMFYIKSMENVDNFLMVDDLPFHISRIDPLRLANVEKCADMIDVAKQAGRLVPYTII